MSDNSNATIIKISQVIDDSLDLLKQAATHPHSLALMDTFPPSLLDQCVELCQKYQSLQQEPLRVVRHFGLPDVSLLLASLATLPNSQVITDLHLDNPRFSDILCSQTLSAKSPDAQHVSSNGQAFRQQQFINDLKQRQQHSRQLGQRLILCDHSPLNAVNTTHSRDLIELLDAHSPLKSILIICNPIHSYPVYCQQHGLSQSSEGFEYYCQQLLDYLEQHSDIVQIRYEDFIEQPLASFQQIGEAFDLPVNDNFLQLRDAFNFSGNSSVQGAFIKDIGISPSFKLFCETIGYEFNSINFILDECLRYEDIHEKVDYYLYGNKITLEDKFNLCSMLADYFYQIKNHLMAQHYIATAKEFIDEKGIKNKLLLAGKLLKYGKSVAALDMAIEVLNADQTLSKKEAGCLIDAYNKLRNDSRVKSEHGHEVLLNYLKENKAKYAAAFKGRKPVLIEIGTTRENVPGQGSTQKIAEYCKSEGLQFITVDMDPHNTQSAKDMFKKSSTNFQAITMKGEDFLMDYKGHMDFVFLDAYDFDHGGHSDLRQSRYEKFLGEKINEELCHKMHLDCAVSVVDKLSLVGLICMDDTWLDNDKKWTAKGTSAMPFFLENGFKVVEARNRSALLERK